jgi:hypothetical protein
MNKHLGHNFWITPKWASDYYTDYCLSGERRSMTLDPNYNKILEAMEDKMDELVGWEKQEWLDPYKDMHNPDRCGTFTGRGSPTLKKLRNRKRGTPDELR